MAGKTILLVDDDLIMRVNIGKNLEKLGYRVLTAEDGNTALALAERSIVFWKRD